MKMIITQVAILVVVTLFTSWTYYPHRSKATFYLGNIAVKDNYDVKVILRYTPRNPILFLSEEWHILGFTTPKEKTVTLHLKKQRKNSFTFSFRKKLFGISKYELNSFEVQCRTSEGKTFSTYKTDVFFISGKGDQNGWVEGWPPPENSGVMRLFKVEFKNTDVRFKERSAEEYNIFERDKDGTLRLDTENCPTVQIDSLHEAIRRIKETK